MSWYNITGNISEIITAIAAILATKMLSCWDGFYTKCKVYDVTFKTLEDIPPLLLARKHATKESRSEIGKPISKKSLRIRFYFDNEQPPHMLETPAKFIREEWAPNWEII